MVRFGYTNSKLVKTWCCGQEVVWRWGWLCLDSLSSPQWTSITSLLLKCERKCNRIRKKTCCYSDISVPSHNLLLSLARLYLGSLADFYKPPPRVSETSNTISAPHQTIHVPKEETVNALWNACSWRLLERNFQTADFWVNRKRANLARQYQ